MVVLPLVLRELNQLSRKKQTFRLRVLLSLLALGMTFFFLTIARFNPGSSSGLSLFRGLSGGLLLFALFEGARSASDCVSREKRDGTLGLLFLTDLKTLDVLSGKLFSASFSVFYSFLAVVPMIAIAWILGGVTPGEVIRMSLVLPLTMLFSLSIGITVSCWGTDERKNLLITLLAIAFLAVLPFILKSSWFTTKGVTQFELLSPVSAYLKVYETAYLQNISTFWLSVGGMAGLSLALLILAGYLLSRRWREDDANGIFNFKHANSPTGRKKSSPRELALRRRLLDTDPAHWLALRSQNSRFNTFRILSTIYVILFPIAYWILKFDVAMSFVVPLGIVWRLFLLAFISYRATGGFSESASNGTLELLLTTPLKHEQLVQGQRVELWNQVKGPLGLILLVETLLIFSFVARNENAHLHTFMSVFTVLLLMNGYFLLYFLTAVHLGMYFALKLKSASRAFFKTLIYLFVIPLCFIWVPLLGLIGMILWPIIWLTRCSDGLMINYRKTLLGKLEA